LLADLASADLACDLVAEFRVVKVAADGSLAALSLHVMMLSTDGYLLLEASGSSPNRLTFFRLFSSLSFADPNPNDDTNSRNHPEICYLFLHQFIDSGK